MQLAMSPIDFNEIQRIAHEQRSEFHQFWTDYERLKDWVVVLIGAAINEGKFIDCDKQDTAGLLLNFDEGAQKRTRLHPDQGDRVDEAIRVGEQVAIIAVRGLLKRPSEITRISALAAGFDDAAVALQVTKPPTF
jgi:hypothetical protein